MVQNQDVAGPPNPPADPSVAEVEALSPRTVLGLGLLLLAIGAIAWVAKAPLTEASESLVQEFGVFGLMAGVLIADVCPIPIPSAPFLIVSYLGGIPFVEVWLLGGLASTVAGPVSYGLGRFLGSESQVAAWTDRAGARALIEKRGPSVVFIVSVSPFPYAATAWAAGAIGIPFAPFAVACCGRFIKIGLYMSAVAAGWASISLSS